MLSLILSALFIAFASICNAIMDVTSHHFERSVFYKVKNKYWWDSANSWKNKYINGDSTLGRIKWNILGIKINKPVQITDAWHFFKTLMIIFLCGAIVAGLTSTMVFSWYYLIAMFITSGVIWNTTFSLFYNRIFK
jgi:hypothetical protein